MCLRSLRVVGGFIRQKMYDVWENLLVHAKKRSEKWEKVKILKKQLKKHLLKLQKKKKQKRDLKKLIDNDVN